MSERKLERSLLDHLRLLILELGKGFAFVGSQYPLEVGGQDYYLDLLFYHLHLRCFVVLELKIEEFKPEFAGKMNFYLSAVDDQLAMKLTDRALGSSSARERMPWWWSMPCATPPNQWVSLSIGSLPRFRVSCKATCRLPRSWLANSP